MYLWMETEMNDYLNVLKNVFCLRVGFTQTYITHKNYEIIGGLFCGMKEDDVNTFGQMSPTDKTCYIYRKCDYPSAMVCECNYDIRPEYASSFVNQVIIHLKRTVSFFWKSKIKFNK